MKYLIDIDNTICKTPLVLGRNMYNLAEPILENIAKVNKLYDEGHEIVYWTGRGATTKWDWSELTIKQLRDWGCKYHSLDIGNKPAFDHVIDDKMININDL